MVEPRRLCVTREVGVSRAGSDRSGTYRRSQVRVLYTERSLWHIHTDRRRLRFNTLSVQKLASVKTYKQLRSNHSETASVLVLDTVGVNESLLCTYARLK